MTRRRIITVIITAALSAGLGFGLGKSHALGATVPAPVRVYCHDAGWRHPDFKPNICLFGQSGAPVMNLHWGTWTAASATANGIVTVFNVCRSGPPGSCGSTRHGLTLRLSVVKVHGTVRYFYQMTVRVRRGTTIVTQTGTYGLLCRTCTMPVWRFPARWPFL